MKLRLVLVVLGCLTASSTQARAMGHGHGMTMTFLYNNLTFRYNLGDDHFKYFVMES